MMKNRQLKKTKKKTSLVPAYTDNLLTELQY